MEIFPAMTSICMQEKFLFVYLFDQWFVDKTIRMTHVDAMFKLDSAKNLAIAESQFLCFFALSAKSALLHDVYLLTCIHWHWQVYTL